LYVDFDPKVAYTCDIVELIGYHQMCMTVQQHKRFLRECKHLDTLKGQTNKKRRFLKKAHEKSDGKCMWCNSPTRLWWELTNEEFKKTSRMRIATFEHLTPKSKGGALKGNAGCACEECNKLRGTISYKQFKWVTETPERYAKFKAKRQKIVDAAHHRKQIKKSAQLIKVQEKKHAQRRKVLNLAILFRVVNQYQQVDLCKQYFYNREIVKQLGVQYGLL